MTRRIAVVGTGTIGASWAACFLANGYDVSATDPARGAERQMREYVDAAWPTLEALGVATGASPSRLAFHAEVGDAVSDAEFVQESGPERLDVKRAVNAAIEASVAPDVVIASSTSGLLISEIQAGTVHPDRFVVGHPYNPPHLIPLVEVVGGVQTDESTIARAMAFYTALGKRPIRLAKELRGHVANRLQAAVWREAFSLISRGVVSVADLDTAMSQGPGLRWALTGPFMTLHSSGGAGGIAHTLDHLGPAIREWADDLGGYPADPDYIPAVLDGVSDALAGLDFVELMAQRDAALVEILASKRQRDL